MKSQESFTLLEVLVAITIFIIIASLGVFALRNVQPNLRLSGTSRDLVTDLRYAQQLAVTEQVDYGVYFSTTTEDKYQIIRHGGIDEVLKEEILPEGINFQYISPLTDNEVRFNPYGAAKEPATTTLVNINGKTKTIRVSPSGFVKIK